MTKENLNKSNNIISYLQDYMFTSENIHRYTKHIIQFNSSNAISSSNFFKPKSISVNNTNDLVLDKINKNTEKTIDTKNKNNNNKFNDMKKKKDTMYRPKQKDSLFWCFYILKNGFFNYEMEINNQYFVVEKNEKFKYIDMLRKNKDLLKIHKIKPLTELEDDLANKDKISIKTFFALCVLENINILLVSKRKIYELLCVDIDEKHPINIVHRNNESYEHSIELDITEDIINKYRETYYKMSNFDAKLKSISSYKLDELLELCKKFDININQKINKYDNQKEGKKKITKKDIYELLALNY